MFRTTVLLAALMLLLVSSSSESADTNGRYWTGGGPGAAGCTTFVAAMEKGRRHKIGSANYINATYGYRTYLLGFQAAYNYVAPTTCDLFGAYTEEQQLAWLENYCRTNPAETFGAATIALAKVAHGNRVQVCK